MHQLVILEMHAVLLDLFTLITIDLFRGFLFFFLHLLFQNETLEGTLPFYPYFLWYNSAKIMFAKIIRKESRLLHSHWKSFIASNTIIHMTSILFFFSVSVICREMQGLGLLHCNLEWPGLEMSTLAVCAMPMGPSHYSSRMNAK